MQRDKTKIEPPCPATIESPGPSFAGYATPEDSVQSAIWACSQGDFRGFLATCTPEKREQIENQVAGKSDEEISRYEKAFANALKDYKVTRTEVISEDE